MSLTKKQLKVAIEMYELCILWATDAVGDTEEQRLLQNALANKARADWLKKFPDLDMPVHISGCIQLAKDYVK